MTGNVSNLGLPAVNVGVDTGVSVVRNFKDSVFRMLFRDRRNLLSLYNALNGTEYEDPDELEINTLENAIYLGRKNDISFVIHNELHLYEHQATVNPNMPLRSLLYIAALYEKMTAGRDLYTSKRLGLPLPSCIVFYNGTKSQPDRQWLKLSDMYLCPEKMEKKEFGLELNVQVININHGCNKQLMQACEALRGYGLYVEKVRQYQKTLGLEQAVDEAVNECIREGILEDFLRQNRAEVKSMSIFEYDQEKHYRQLELDAIETGMERGMELGMERGMRQGMQQGLLDLLEEKGDIPAALRERIQSETDMGQLSKWLKTAAKVESLNQFEQQIGCQG